MFFTKLEEQLNSSFKTDDSFLFIVLQLSQSVCQKDHIGNLTQKCFGGCGLTQCDLSCEIFFSFSFSSVFTDIFPFQLHFSFCKFSVSFSLFYF